MSEYIADNLQGKTVETHVRLGLPEALKSRPPGWEKMRPFYVSTLLEADLIYQEDGEVWILEFGVWRPQTKLGQLQVYKTLLADTPGYLDTPPEKIRLKIVVGRDEATVRQVAEALNVDVEVYQPDWLRQALISRMGRQAIRPVKISGPGAP